MVVVCPGSALSDAHAVPMLDIDTMIAAAASLRTTGVSLILRP
jgi:hypothetical protein